MHSQSKTWRSQPYMQRGEMRQLNESRRKISPRSPFFYYNFDKKKHNEEWALGERRRKFAAERYKTNTAEEQIRLRGLGLPSPTPKRAAFDNKTYKTNRSNVLSRKTIFCPQWREGKDDVAPWPGKEEMVYEGGGRVQTDPLHRRFLGIPRVGGNDTVNWQQRAHIPQYALEEYYYPLLSPDDRYIRRTLIGEWEIDDEEGKELLGADLMGMLDPQDQW